MTKRLAGKNFDIHASMQFVDDSQQATNAALVARADKLLAVL